VPRVSGEITLPLRLWSPNLTYVSLPNNMKAPLLIEEPQKLRGDLLDTLEAMRLRK
jgi:hypothetical protein